MRWLGAPALFLALVACDTSLPASSPVFNSPSVEDALSPASVEFRTVAIGRWLPVAKHWQASVLHSQQDLDNLYATADKQSFGPIEVGSPIDFSNEFGVLVLSPLEVEGAVIEVTAVEDRQQDLRIHAVQWSCQAPSPRPMVDDPDKIYVCHNTRPFQLIALRRTTKPVSFAPFVDAYLAHRPTERPWAYPDPILNGQ